MNGDNPGSVDFIEPPDIGDLFDFTLLQLRNYISSKNFTISGRNERDLLRLAVQSYKNVSFDILKNHATSFVYSRRICTFVSLTFGVLLLSSLVEKTN